MNTFLLAKSLVGELIWKEPLTLMWKGLLGVFIVAGVSFLVVLLLNKISNRKKNPPKSDVSDNESEAKD